MKHEIEINYLRKIWQEMKEKIPMPRIVINSLRKIWHEMKEKISDS